MELVYPIYIDTPMMTSFLASLEGGLIEEASLEEKTSNSTEKGKSGGGGAKVGGLLSGLLTLEGKADLTQKVSDSLESNYRSTVRFPEASLFIRLRELLKQEQLLHRLSETDFDELNMGELIEFSGTALPNPAYQIRRFAQQLSPLLNSMTTMQNRQMENQIHLMEKLKPNQPITIDGEELMFSSPVDVKAAITRMQAVLDAKKNESGEITEMIGSIEQLLPHDHLDKLVFDMNGMKAVCLVYPDFARDKRVQDIHNAYWSCIGKVIGKVEQGESYDLLRGLPAGYFASNLLSGLTQTLSAGDVNLELTEPQVEGPVFIIATLAIFS